MKDKKVVRIKTNTFEDMKGGGTPSGIFIIMFVIVVVIMFYAFLT